MSEGKQRLIPLNKDHHSDSKNKSNIELEKGHHSSSHNRERRNSNGYYSLPPFLVPGDLINVSSLPSIPSITTDTSVGLIDGLFTVEGNNYREGELKREESSSLMTIFSNNISMIERRRMPKREGVF